MKPRLLLVARERYGLPLAEPLRRKFDALEAQFEVRVVASAPDGRPDADARFRLARPLRPQRLDGLGFYLALPARVARELRSFRPDAVLAQGTHETAAVLLARSLARRESVVILDLHGDWRAATRLYGSRLRRLLDPAGDLISQVAVRRADAIRTVSPFTSGLVRELGREPAGMFPAYVDVASFLDRPPAPLPELPVALFVGALERTKNVDGLVAAWPLVAREVPDATLRLVGRGREEALVRRLVAELPEQAEWTQTLTNAEVATALDAASALVLPSRSEGLPRVVLEAFARGRGVVASGTGGLRDLIDDGEHGLLVTPGDTAALARALVRVLSDRDLAERLGAAARRRAEDWVATPEQFAARLRALVDEVRT